MECKFYFIHKKRVAYAFVKNNIFTNHQQKKKKPSKYLVFIIHFIYTNKKSRLIVVFFKIRKEKDILHSQQEMIEQKKK